MNRSTPHSGWPSPPSIVAAREGVARQLALLIVGVTLLLFVVDRLMGVPIDADSLLGLALGAVALIGWWLLKGQRFTGVAWLLVGSLLLQASASAYFYGSVRTMNIWLVVVAQIAVGIFLSRRALVWATLGVMVLLGLLTWADAQGYLHARPTFEVGWRTWAMQAACLVGVAVMVYLNRTQMHTVQRQQLQEAEQRLQALLERDLGKERFSRIFFSSPAPIFVQSARNGHILDVNPAFERVMGYSREAVLARRDAFLWRQDEQHQRFVQLRRSASRTGWQPITGVCANGQDLDLLICSERDEDAEDSLVITALRLRPEGVEHA